MSSDRWLVLYCLSSTALVLWLFYGFYKFKTWLKDKLGINEYFNK